MFRILGIDGTFVSPDIISNNELLNIDNIGVITKLPKMKIYKLFKKRWDLLCDE